MNGMTAGCVSMVCLMFCVVCGLTLLAAGQPAASQPASRPAASGPAAAMPGFVQKVQLHNLAGAEATADGLGVKLYRMPRHVREQMTETNKSSGKTGADTMLHARHSEIRFVLNEGEKPENIKIHLQCSAAGDVAFFWGDTLCGEERLSTTQKVRPIVPRGHGLLYSLMDRFPRGRYANQVCRVVLSGGEFTLTGIEGDVRPPRPDELAPVMVSYGTSISQGAMASRADLAWNALTARALGYDLVNLGASGTAFCERAVADYMAKLSWDLCVLEISVNMAGNGVTTEEFRTRAAYMVDTLAKSHPNGHVVCISLFPYGTGDLWKGSTAKEYRAALEEICKNSPHKNVHFVPGPELLSWTGLGSDLLHPSDHGMIEIASKLAPRIQEFLKGKSPAASTKPANP